MNETDDAVKTALIDVITTGQCWFAMLTLTIAACPHCNSTDALIVSDVERHGYPPEQWPSAVYCGTCGATGPWEPDEEAAVRRWNRISGTDTDRGRFVRPALQYPLEEDFDSDRIPF